MLIKINPHEFINFDKIINIIDSGTGILFVDSDKNEVRFRCKISIKKFTEEYSEAKKNGSHILDLTKPESKLLSLEVGKTYMTRLGKEVLIVDFSKDVPYPFEGNLEGTVGYYTSKGEYLMGRETDFDIIGEKSA